MNNAVLASLVIQFGERDAMGNYRVKLEPGVIEKLVPMALVQLVRHDDEDSLEVVVKMPPPK